MTITWYETNMTSNTEPSPLVASASSEYLGTNEYGYAYKAFDGIKSEGTTLATFNYWSTASGQQEMSWIKLDFGETKEVNRVELVARNSYYTQTPTEFAIEGSNDDLNWVPLGYFYKTWTSSEKAIFDLEYGEYRYFKIICVNSNHGSNCSFTEITYGYEEVAPPKRKEPKGVIYSGGKYHSIDKNAMVTLPSLNQKYIDVYGIGAEGAVVSELTHKKHIYEQGTDLQGARLFPHKIYPNTGIKNYQTERIDHIDLQ